MNLKCKLIGHEMVRELQGEDKNCPQKVPGWEIFRSIMTVYSCKRCCYTFTNTVNFGKELEVKDA